jgi:multidrug efflux pump
VRISEVCIERPVLATVMSLVIVLFGLISLTRIANRELPDVDPPVVSVTTIYPGAAPEVVETSITSPLEDQIIGIEGVRHVTSTSREQVSQISVEFDLDRDIEAAANDVRDRVARARRGLPEGVEEPLVAKRDADAWPIMWLAMAGQSTDQIQLSKIADTLVKDRLGKLPGVATVMVGGERRYSMRLWIDNERLTAHNLTIADVSDALRRENVDIPSGRVESADIEYTVRSLGELQTVQAYEGLIVAVRGDEPVRLRDVARVEVGPEDDRKLVRFNGDPALGLGVVKQSKANTLTVASAVRNELERLNRELPGDVQIHIAYDASDYIRRSISDVTRTIFEAIVLVVFVIYLFLRTARATVIPAIAIPVSILGTFSILYFTGFTINTLTLMGLTLAIGLVVDDAIVVLENITRWVEDGTPPLEAARRGMREISFAVVAATVSAVAVFLPLLFLQDTTGRLFREFAVTVGGALLISGFVALTLSPALCARVLRPTSRETGVKALLARGFDGMASQYGRWLVPVLKRPRLVVALGALWVLLGVVLYGTLDEELIPNSDRGTVLAFTRAPEGSTIEYTDRYQRAAEQLLLEDEDVARVFSVVALGIGTPGLVNEGFLWTSLVPSSERDASQQEIVDRLVPRFKSIPGITAFPFNPSPLRGFGATPVSMVIQGPDVQELSRYADAIVERLEETPGFKGLRTDLFLNKPQLEVVIDRERASDLGASARDIANTLQILLGGLDVSSFKLGGETYDVIAQLPRASRSTPRDLVDLYVRGRQGRLVSLSQVVEARPTIAPRALPHHDRLRSVTITADLSGLAQGEALARAESVARDVVPEGGGYRITFSGESERFFESGNELAFAYALAILVVYLVLAAQFESFVHPLTILVAVALSFTGALLTLLGVAWLSGFGWTALPGTLNIYSKIGLVMLVGLVTKNSILIVEFANQLRARGVPLIEATQRAARTRFRPILMTALATMVGILPIALGLGAGGESRAPLGLAVVGGMLFSTLLTFFVVPATYVTIAQVRSARQPHRASAAASPIPQPEGSPVGGGS